MNRYTLLLILLVPLPASVAHVVLWNARLARALLLLMMLALACCAGCGEVLPVDSSSPAFTGPADRVAWMQQRIRRSPPSAMRDAHFLERESNPSGGHMVGPGPTTYLFCAKIEIDPADAPAWAARTRSAPAPADWRRDQNPMRLDLHQGAAWQMHPADFDKAQWLDPKPLFNPGAHGGYQAGYMAINDAGTAVYVWQHWRR